jgi:hypothetical protein
LVLPRLQSNSRSSSPKPHAWRRIQRVTNAGAKLIDIDEREDGSAAPMHWSNAMLGAGGAIKSVAFQTVNQPNRFGGIRGGMIGTPRNKSLI